jgi:MFS family permease
MSRQFHLLSERRFGPFFLTQFCGAFNDNLFKNALVVLLTFQAARYTTLSHAVLVNLCAGLFILPFFLFSATAGQLADKFEKSGLIRLVKQMEVGIMLLGGLGFWLESLGLLLATLFLMGAQSALFGPVKYALLPQVLAERELIGGNGLVESGTFVAILLGTLAGGLLISFPGGTAWVTLACVVVAVAGYLASRRIPPAAACDPTLTIALNPLSETLRNLRFTYQQRGLFLAILGISWFWFYGAVFLSQFPAFAKDTLGGDEQTVTVLLAVFSVGIGLGSLWCERLSGHHIEIGLVPLGSLGLTVMALDLWWAASHWPLHAQGTGLGSLLGEWAFWRILFDLLAIGVFGGFYIVPLYALVQNRSDPANRARIIAGNNILNALFMVLAAGMAAGLLSMGLRLETLFLITAILNTVMGLYLYLLLPAFLRRFVLWLGRGFGKKPPDETERTPWDEDNRP